MQNNLKKYLVLVLLLISCFGSGLAVAQDFGSNRKSDETPVFQQTVENEGFKPDVKLSLGTSFASFAPGFNSFGTYIAPEISMPVSKKVDVSFGMAYSSMFYSSQEQSGFGSPNNYGSIFVSGTYHVNEKISIRGTGYKTFLLNPSNFSENNNSSYFDFSNQGAILDLEYRVTDHFRINASFHYREQNYPDFYPGNPMNSFGSPDNFNSGFGGSPFGGFGPGF
jgi:hypothetical protein